MSESIHDRHRDRGYKPDPAWSPEQRAWLEDLLTSQMCRAELLEREAKKLKTTVVSVLAQVREG